QATFGGAIQPTVDILTVLHGSGHSLYALSNWSAEKFAVVRPQYPFLEWFEDIVLSGDLRMAKPDPLIFMAFLQRTGLNAPDCLFIDDSAANIQVSSQMGFGTILFQSPAQLKDDLQNRGLLN
ncbi:MAG: HAD-IA family hydrolase, partial [Anaerolineaceae bacterium]|nr:HAD-IA family hydrolase [Anaerolineaceae bacterium]